MKMLDKTRTPSREPTGAALLQEGVTRSIHRAALIELAKSGYARLTMQAVARRAGVGKAALYRRWAGKEEMVINLLSTVSTEIVSIEDTGGLRSDIEAFLHRSIKILRRPLARRILPDLYTEMSRNTTLAKALRENIEIPKRERGRVLIERAIKRGEISASIDQELAMDLMAGPLYWRMIVTQGAVSGRYVDNLANALIAAMQSSSDQIM